MRYAVARFDLPAVAETRRLLRDHLRQWGVPALTDTAELLTTELVTNALQHTQGGAVMTATLSPEPHNRLRVEVSDSTARRPPRLPLVHDAARHDPRDPAAPGATKTGPRPGAPSPNTASLDAVLDDAVLGDAMPPDALDAHGTSGRGLLLVAALSDAWGIRPRGGGKVVWFELDADAA